LLSAHNGAPVELSCVSFVLDMELREDFALVLLALNQNGFHDMHIEEAFH
jgi:hypothetical protein